MTTVKIDVELITTAISELKDLANDITTQRHSATMNTPIRLPSLGEGTLGKVSRWLTDHLDDLETRRDLAILLDKKGTGKASYTVTRDTLANAKQLLGQALADTVGNLDHKADHEEIERVNALLRTWQQDEAVMASMFEDLDADGTVAALAHVSEMMRFGGEEMREACTELAKRIRTGLASASEAPGFPAEDFARDIVRYCTVALLDDDEESAFFNEFRVNHEGANILTFLMQETNYHDSFLLSAARTLETFERMDTFLPYDDWYRRTGTGFLDTDGAYDPMAAIMHNFGENPQAGLTFFTEPTADGFDRQTYYFNDREWKADGYGGISHAVEGIGTDAANLKSSPGETTALVSRFLDLVANSDGFNAEKAKPASPHIADLLKFYMPAVDTALRNKNQDGDGGSGELKVPGFGTFEHYPVLFTGDLDSLMQVAMSTQEGTQSVAEGIGTYQQTVINNLSAALANDPGNDSLRAKLRDTVQKSASLQGFGEYSIGRVEIDGAASRDAQRQAFIDLVGDAAGFVPLPGADAVGDLGGKLIDYGYSKAVNLGTDAAGDTFASEEARATDKAEERAEAGSTRAKINTFVSLAEAGIIPRDQIPDMWKDSRGRLINPSDIDPSRISLYAQSAMNEVVTHGQITDHDIESPYKMQFLEFYTSAASR